MHDSFEDKFKDLAKFFNAAAHELRTPVTTAKIYVQLLQEMGSSSADAVLHTNLSKTEGQLNKLNLLISNVLDVSRMHAGKFSIATENVVIGDCIHSAVSTRKELQEKFNCTVIGETGLQVQANKDRLIQVLSNLLDNAMKFSKPQSKITIQVSHSGDIALLTVSDEGRGMSSETLAHAFSGYEPDSPTKTKGLHIGLNISKAIIEAMHGSIRIDSEENKGTRVLIELPLAKNI